jgi:hypothetical protein
LDDSFEMIEVGGRGTWAGSSFGDFYPSWGKARLLDHDPGTSVLSGDALPAGAPSLAGFGDERTMFLQFEAVCDPFQLEQPARFVCGYQGGRFWGYVFASIDSAVVVGGNDADGDGVDDAIDTGDGAFDDGAGTTGAILDRAGLEVSVSDDAPGGVRVSAPGVGGPARLVVCGFEVMLVGASSASITCGSIIVADVEGNVTVVLDGAGSVQIPAGSAATVDRLDGGGFVVTNSGPTGTISVTLAGVTTGIPSGSPARTTRPLTEDDCKKAGWVFYGIYANQGRCVSAVATAAAARWP